MGSRIKHHAYLYYRKKERKKERKKFGFGFPENHNTMFK
jgi:hypothetical protein